MHQQFREEKPVVHAYSAAFRTYVHQLSLPWSKPQRGNLLRLGAAFLVARGTLPIRRLARPLLLMDRGFDKGPLLRWLLEHDWRFIVRIQRGHLLWSEAGVCLNDAYDARGQLTHTGPLHPRPGQVLRFPRVTYLASQRLSLHLVVCARWDPKAAKVKEWRLVTNLP